MPDETRILKIDQDCFVPKEWTREYINIVISICFAYDLRVLRIRTCPSRRKGLHYYIDIAPSIDLRLANRLQFLLGDDRLRVALNQARIDSNLSDPIKLFERAGSRLRTVYENSRVPAGTTRNKRHRR